MCPRASRLCWSTYRWVSPPPPPPPPPAATVEPNSPGLCLCAPQTDLVDQNLLNFLPIGEHSDVYKALSTHPSDPESLNTDFMKSKSCLCWFWISKQCCSILCSVSLCFTCTVDLELLSPS